MGGINHQPCSNYLERSTRLSRSLSEGRIAIEQVNIALENVLLTEIEKKGDNPNFSELFAKLKHSNESNSIIMSDIKALRAKMDTLEFQDLSSLKEVNLDLLGIQMSERCMVGYHSWNQAKETIKSEGFYGMVSEFENIINNIIEFTVNLEEAFNLMPKDGPISDILEKNLPGNIKCEFAQLYHSWNSFQEKFLASSLISTNLWYHHQSQPMMVEYKEVVLK